MALFETYLKLRLKLIDNPVTATRVLADSMPTLRMITSGWPEAKQVRAKRNMLKRMRKHDFGKIVQGTHDLADYLLGRLDQKKVQDYFLVGKRQIRMAATGISEIVKEDKNPSQTDDYWNTIKDSYLIAPYFNPFFNEFYALVMREDFGLFEYVNTIDKTQISSLEEQLIGKKAIFLHPTDSANDYINDSVIKLATDLVIPTDAKILTYPRVRQKDILDINHRLVDLSIN